MEGKAKVKVGDTVYIEDTLPGRNTITPMVVFFVGRKWFNVKGLSARFSVADGSPDYNDWPTNYRAWFRMTDFEDEKWRCRALVGILPVLARVDVATLRKVAELIGYQQVN